MPRTYTRRDVLTGKAFKTPSPKSKPAPMTQSPDETPTLPMRVIPPKLRLPHQVMPRATQRERDEAAAAFGLWLDSLGFVREYPFARASGRRWRIDHCETRLMIAVEIEGGDLSGGRHVRPLGFARDCEKYNHAVLMGFALLRFTIGHILSGYAMQTVETALAQARARQQQQQQEGA